MTILLIKSPQLTLVSDFLSRMKEIVYQIKPITIINNTIQKNTFIYTKLI